MFGSLSNLFKTKRNPLEDADPSFMAEGDFSGGTPTKGTISIDPMTEGSILVDAFDETDGLRGFDLKGEDLARTRKEAAVKLIEYDRVCDEQVAVLEARYQTENNRSLSSEERAEKLSELDGRLNELDEEASVLFGGIRSDQSLLGEDFPGNSDVRRLSRLMEREYTMEGGKNNPYQKSMGMEMPGLSLEPLPKKAQNGLNFENPGKPMSDHRPISPDGWNLAPKALSDPGKPLDFKVSPEEKAAMEEALANKVDIPMRQETTDVSYGNTPVETPSEAWFAAEREGAGSGVRVVEMTAERALGTSVAPVAESGVEVTEITAERAMHDVQDLRNEYEKTIGVMRRNPVLEGTFAVQVEIAKEAYQEALKTARFTLAAELRGEPEGERKKSLMEMFASVNESIKNLEETEPETAEPERQAA